MKIDFNIAKDKELTTLNVSGDLVAQNAPGFKEQLQNLSNEEGAIQLSLKNTETIDVSALQLVKSFKQLVASTHRELQIVPPDSADIITLLAKAGLFSILQSHSNLKFNTKQ
jgi:anti-anti-sigma factor